LNFGDLASRVSVPVGRLHAFQPITRWRALSCLSVGTLRKVAKASLLPPLSLGGGSHVLSARHLLRSDTLVSPRVFHLGPQAWKPHPFPQVLACESMSVSYSRQRESSYARPPLLFEFRATTLLQPHSFFRSDRRLGTPILLSDHVIRRPFFFTKFPTTSMVLLFRATFPPTSTALLDLRPSPRRSRCRVLLDSSSLAAPLSGLAISHRHLTTVKPLPFCAGNPLFILVVVESPAHLRNVFFPHGLIRWFPFALISGLSVLALPFALTCSTAWMTFPSSTGGPISVLEHVRLYDCVRVLSDCGVTRGLGRSLMHRLPSFDLPRSKVSRFA